MCISSPPVTDPCYYGIDTSVRKELIASTHTEEEIRQYIGADSLHYISLEGLKRSLDCMDPEECAMPALMPNTRIMRKKP